MDWTGAGIAILFFVCPYIVKDMPPAVAWGGVALGIVLSVWKHIPADPKYNGPLAVAGAIVVLAAAAISWGLAISRIPERKAGETRIVQPHVIQRKQKSSSPQRLFPVPREISPEKALASKSTKEPRKPSPSLAHAPSAPAPIPARPLEPLPSRFAITRTGFANSVTGDPTSDRSIRVFFRNDGATLANAPAIASQFRIVADPLSDAEINSLADETNKVAFQEIIFDRDRSQVEQNVEYWKDSGQTISMKDFQESKDNKRILYFFFSMTYTDTTLPKRHYWLKEYVSLQRLDEDNPTIIRSRTFEKIAP